MSMTPLELETQLIERTIKQRNELLARARESAEKILKAAEEEVERIGAESERQILSLVGSELRAVRDRIVGETELEGRKMLMLSRQELLTRVFDEAEGRLAGIAEGKDEATSYDEVLGRLIVEAASAIGGEEFIVSANERDLTYLKKNLKKAQRQVREAIGGSELRLDEIPLDAMGGVVVRNSDGTKTYNNTLEGRLEGVKARIQAEVAQILGLI